MKHDLANNSWKTLRIPCLALVLGGTIIALGIGSKTPLQPRPEIAAYIFPATIDLPNWQQTDHYPLPKPEDKKLAPIASQAYQYQRDGKVLTIEMRYLTAAKGDIAQFMRWHTKIPDSVSTEIQQNPDNGSYIFFTYQNKAYLSACINPQGASTATGRQYLQSKLLSGINPKQFVGWLTGKDTLFDQRCLWSHLSLPLRPATNPSEARQILQESWGSWYIWWVNHFPKS
jgi:cyanosortase A-associated protein